MTNAVKYTPPVGRIRVAVPGDADEAVFRVEDGGFGIAPELLPSIFDMFVQGETTLDRARGGLGIGHSGLDLMAREHPDVAIIDIGLPELDGYQLARRIRALPHGGAMMLVALTGYGSPLDRDRSVEAGFDHHLVQPVDFDEPGRLLDAHAACAAPQALPASAFRDTVAGHRLGSRP